MEPSEKSRLNRYSDPPRVGFVDTRPSSFGDSPGVRWKLPWRKRGRYPRMIGSWRNTQYRYKVRILPSVRHITEYHAIRPVSTMRLFTRRCMTHLRRGWPVGGITVLEVVQYGNRKRKEMCMVIVARSSQDSSQVKDVPSTTGM